MTTTIIVHHPSDEDLKSSIEHPSTFNSRSDGLKLTTFKPFPRTILDSIKQNRNSRLINTRLHRYSIGTIDDDLDENDDEEETTNTDIHCPQRSPSEIRINVHPNVSNEQRAISHIQIPLSTLENGLRVSKQNRVEYFRRVLLDHRFGRRIHSTYSTSTTTLRSITRRRSTQIFAQRFYRRQPGSLSRTSKWHFVRHHLHDIAMMNESYARMKKIEQDLRWIHLREQICKRVLDMREMSLLRQQDDGKVKKSQKSNFDLKTIPINEVVHVERDGRVYSIGTRDLVLGRWMTDGHIQLDTFAHLDARRKFQVKQNLLRQQEGRTRLKKYIAFSVCLCNLSFIVLMFAAMFIFAMKTIIELKSRKSF